MSGRTVVTANGVGAGSGGSACRAAFVSACVSEVPLESRYVSVMGQVAHVASNRSITLAPGASGSAPEGRPRDVTPGIRVNLESGSN
jgi:hypothetical protein